MDHKLQQQADEYSALTDIHDGNPASARYWGDHHFRNLLFEATGAIDSSEFQFQWLERICRGANGRTVRVLSIGAGECAEEITVARRARGHFDNFVIECVDVATQAIARARQTVAAEGLSERFRFVAGIYQPLIASPADMVIVNQALHHFTDLEGLFNGIQAALGEHGVFVTNDMIGRNGHMLWPEALAIVDRLWTRLPDRYKQNHCLGRFEATYGNWDNSREMNEGIRAQDILPELLKRFHFRDFVASGNIAFALFGRHFGLNFDPAVPADRAYIDQISQLDRDLIDMGYLSPVLMVAAMANTPGPLRCYRHWTPEFCLRRDPLVDVARQHRFNVGDPIEIAERKPGAVCLGDGWSSPEQTGVWSNAERSTLRIPLAMALPACRLSLIAAGMQFRPDGIDVGPISVHYGGAEVASLEFGGLEGGPVAREIVLYLEDTADMIELEFVYATPIVPARFGLSPEQRMFALQLIGLQIMGFTPTAAIPDRTTPVTDLVL